jgi:signal transduction histidine kinase
VKWLPISNGDDVYGLIMKVSDITEKKLLQDKLEQELCRRQMEITNAVITAEENERRRIGLELHDNVNQVLAAAQLFVGLAKISVGNKHVCYLVEVDKHISAAINEIRNLSHSMTPPLVDETGLKDSLGYLLELISKTTHLSIEAEIEIDERFISNKFKTAIYRIVQEQLNNILKHARARNISLKLTQAGTQTVLSIKDDGIGFDTSLKPQGIGLMNIRTRALLINGKVHINSSPGNGFELIVDFKYC